jgi:hypothetical protein
MEADEEDHSKAKVVVPDLVERALAATNVQVIQDSVIISDIDDLR